MRYFWLVVACLFAAASVSAAEIEDVKGLKDAVNSHRSALVSGDRTQVAKTVVFPHVQFRPNGQISVYQQEADLPNRGGDEPQWTITDMKLISLEAESAIVRVSFGMPDGTDSGSAGLWCFVLKDDRWLVYWRHFLGESPKR